MHDRRISTAITSGVVLLFIVLSGGALSLCYLRHFRTTGLIIGSIVILIVGLAFFVRVANFFRRDYEPPLLDDEEEEERIMRALRDEEEW